MTRLDFFQGSMPRQVGSVSDCGKGKKGKIKTTGEKGKGKGKGKDKNKHKRNIRQLEQGTGQLDQVVSNKHNSRAVVHTARSGATNAQIVVLDWRNRRMVQ